MKYKNIVLIMTLIFSTHNSFSSDDQIREESFFSMFDTAYLVVSGKFDLVSVPDINNYGDVLGYGDTSYIKFDINHIYKGDEEGKEIFVRIHNYILPNEDGTMSRGHQWYQKYNSDVKKLKELRRIMNDLKSQLSSGEIDQASFDDQLEDEVTSKIRNAGFDTAYYFDSPYKGEKFFIRKDREFILFLKRAHIAPTISKFSLVDLSKGIVVSDENVRSLLLQIKEP